MSDDAYDIFGLNLLQLYSGCLVNLHAISSLLTILDGLCRKAFFSVVVAWHLQSTSWVVFSDVWVLRSSNFSRAL